MRKPLIYLFLNDLKANVNLSNLFARGLFGACFSIFGLLFFVFVILSCSKKNEPAPKDSLLGRWKFDAYYRQQNCVTTNLSFYEDGSFIEFFEEGTYQGKSDSLKLYFALQSLSKQEGNFNLGLWQLSSGGRKLHFDRGTAEFYGKASLLFDVVRLAENHLEISIEGPQALYDFGNIYAAQQNLFVAEAIVDSYEYGFRFGRIIGNWKGYLEGFGSKPLISDAYFKGFAEGYVNGYNTIKIPSTYTLYKSGFDAGYANAFEVGRKRGQAIDSSATHTYKLIYKFSR